MLVKMAATIKLLLITTLFLVIITTECKSSLTEGNYTFIPYSKQKWHKVFQNFAKLGHVASGTDKKECLACELVVGALLMERKFDMTNIQMGAEAGYFCSKVTEYNDRFCEGIIDINIDSLTYIMDNKKDLNAAKVCNLLLNCTLGQGSFDWSLSVPSGSTVSKVNSTGETVFTIVHLTDIHYDPDYIEGKKLKCQEVECCQADNDDAGILDEACGYWGSIEDAGVPKRLLENVLDRINEEHFDYVYFTGDLVSHKVWDTSIEYNSKSISEVMDLFAEKFGDKKVFPILGNHEAHPVNVFSPLNITDEKLSNQWLYELVLEKWSVWLGEDIKETVLKGGYYTVSPRTNFRIIVLNNNVCQKENWWLLYDSYDPMGQLQWLTETLQNAENQKEIVHLLIHVPNSSCFKSWSVQFDKIIKRFANTIAAQFTGHTHRDQFFIHYDKKTPVSVNLNGGSLMPDKANPNFKIYTVDSTGFDVLNSECYIFDLVAANAAENHTFEWYRLYDFKQQFGVAKLVPTELDKLVTNMITNSTLAQQYYRYYYRNSSNGQDCDQNCQQSVLCEIVTTVAGTDCPLTF